MNLTHLVLMKFFAGASETTERTATPERGESFIGSRVVCFTAGRIAKFRGERTVEFDGD